MRPMLLPRNAGFTLVEVLVALGIFAVLATGYLISAGDAVRGLGLIQDKMMASWVAQDTITKLRTLDADKSDRFRDQTMEAMGRDWSVSFETKATEVESMSRVIISVGIDEPLVSLETYFISE